MADPTSAHSSHGTMLRNKFELEKRRHTHADPHVEAVKNLPNMAASPLNHSQKQRVGSKAMGKEEIVRYMSNLPSYLERGKATQDRALNFGVMDWGRLEKWQYQHLKQGTNKCSPSTTKSSPLFSTDGSSPQSSRGQSCSPARQKPLRVTLQSHFDISAKETFPVHVKSSLGNVEQFQDFKDAPIYHCTERTTTNQLETEQKDCKMYDIYPPNLQEPQSSVNVGSCGPKSSLKGKMKIQEEVKNEVGDRFDHGYIERGKTVVFVPRNCHGNSETNAKNSVGVDHRTSSERIRSDLNDNTPSSCPRQSEVVVETGTARNRSSASRSNALEEKKVTVSLKNSNLNSCTTAASKQRSMSPIRRVSFSMSAKFAASTSATKRAESPPPSGKSTRESSRVSNRAHSSPLRRLLEPLFTSKATNSRQSAETPDENSKIKAKAKLDLRSCKEVSTDDDSHRHATSESPSTKQALFQTVIKNGSPLFTFAVENNSDILAATVRRLNSSGKDNCNSWFYTFFTVNEVKTKNGNWLSHGIKGKGHGYVPNIAAQMKVSNPSVSNSSTREFVLFSVDRSRLDSQISNVQPHDELAAIVVKFSRKVDDIGENQESFSTTVILPCGNHGAPSKGEPSPLVARWLSGGVCDCGGWDLGCRIRTLTSQVQSSRRSSSTKDHMITGQFELFFQGDVVKERPFFSLCPLKEGIFSVEYNSSLSLLQAFSICISVLECRTSSQHTVSQTYVAEQVHDDPGPVSFASFPPLSPVGRV